MCRWLAIALTVSSGCGKDPTQEHRTASATGSTKPVERWAVDLSGKRSTVKSVAVTSDGGVCIAGFFEGVLELGKQRFVAQGSGYNIEDGFVACYGADRALRWAHVLTGPGTDGIDDLAIGPDDDVAVVGVFGMTDQGTGPITGELAGAHLESGGRD